VPWTRIRFLSASYRIAFRKKIYRSIDELQADLDAWPHQGRWCFGKTPMQTFLDALITGEGETHGCLTADDRYTASNSQHYLSAQV